MDLKPESETKMIRDVVYVQRVSFGCQKFALHLAKLDFSRIIIRQTLSNCYINIATHLSTFWRKHDDTSLFIENL